MVQWLGLVTVWLLLSTAFADWDESEEIAVRLPLRSAAETFG